jgi:hypothetical protein
MKNILYICLGNAQRGWNLDADNQFAKASKIMSISG